jgi:hypothetical protein
MQKNRVLKPLVNKTKISAKIRPKTVPKERNKSLIVEKMLETQSPKAISIPQTRNFATKKKEFVMSEKSAKLCPLFIASAKKCEALPGSNGQSRQTCRAPEAFTYNPFFPILIPTIFPRPRSR